MVVSQIFVFSAHKMYHEKEVQLFDTNLTNIIEKARSERRDGELSSSLATYEIALRMVTPNDDGFSKVLAFKDAGIPFKGLSEDPEADSVDSSLRSEMVEILREMFRFDEAYHHARIAQYLDELLHGYYHNDNAASLLDLGLIELSRHRPAEAEIWLRKSEEVDASLLVSDPDNFRIQHRLLARAELWAHWGHLKQQAETFLMILPKIENLLEPYTLVQHLNSGSQAMQNLNEHELARQLLLRAIKIQEERAPDHPQLGRLYSNLALVRLEQLEFSDAKRFSEDATRLERFIPEKHRFEELPRVFSDERTHIEGWMNSSRRYFEEGGTRKSYDIAISFNTRDESVVETLRSELEQLGLRTWWFKEDRNWDRPMADSEIEERVHKAISNAHMVVFVGSNTSFTSQFVLDEVDHAYSVRAPFLIWYPEGVRIKPTEVARRSNSSPDHLMKFFSNLLRPGVFAYYGYGLRKPDVSAIATAIKDRFTSLVVGHPISIQYQEMGVRCDVLYPTRLWPVFVDDDGQPIFPGMVR
jgi:tetratricopeptide (TPR) repeat protein